jgi:putative ubiquitin-RnfH superfamily antitoxin RatB of RatAB toxin-antitoxin module
VKSNTHKKPSTKNIKKLLKSIVDKALEKFPGDNAEQKKKLFINALSQKQGSAVIVDVNTLGFNKMLAPTDLISNTGAAALFDALKDTQAVRDADSRISARKAARETAIQSANQAGVASAQNAVAPAIDFSKQMIGLYTDGVLDDSTIDTGAVVEIVYPKIIESLKRLGAKHSAMTGELARLTKEANSPSKSALSTPAKSVASPLRTSASSAYSGTLSDSTPISTIKPLKIDFDSK